ncbi:hypothetical protein FQZ97_981660 [compost metagenome]
MASATWENRRPVMRSACLSNTATGLLGSWFSNHRRALRMSRRMSSRVARPSPAGVLAGHDGSGSGLAAATTGGADDPVRWNGASNRTSACSGGASDPKCWAAQATICAAASAACANRRSGAWSSPDAAAARSANCCAMASGLVASGARGIVKARSTSRTVRCRAALAAMTTSRTSLNRPMALATFGSL